MQRDALLKELGEAANGSFKDVASVQARIDALEATMRDELVTLRFRALSFDRWNGIIALRPPREGVAFHPLICDAHAAFPLCARTYRLRATNHRARTRWVRTRAYAPCCMARL